jgi:hypothetical protein
MKLPPRWIIQHRLAPAVLPPVGLRQGQATAERPKSPWADLKCSESIGKCRRYTASPKSCQTRIGGFKSATAHEVEQGEAETRHDVAASLRREAEDHTECGLAAPVPWRVRRSLAPQGTKPDGHDNSCSSVGAAFGAGDSRRRRPLPVVG